MNYIEEQGRVPVMGSFDVIVAGGGVAGDVYKRQTQTSGKQGYGDIQGIWQTVWLENRGESYIESFRFITKISGEVSLSVKARAADGEIVTARFDGRSWQAAVKDGEAHMTLALDNQMCIRDRRERDGDGARRWL